MHKSAQSGNALFRGPMPRYAQLADILRRRIARKLHAARLIARQLLGTLTDEG